MMMLRSSMLFLVLATVVVTQRPGIAEARTMPILSLPKGLSRIYGTLGVVCKCCDGVEADKTQCSSTWNGSCRELQCLPWRIG